MSKQKTIGLNPLIEYLSDKEPNKELQKEQKTQPTATRYEQQSWYPVKKQRVTIHVPVDLIERVKNAVFWEPGLTLAEFAEEALAKAIDALEQEKGTPFPQRRRPLRGGRPLK